MSKILLNLVLIHAVKLQSLDIEKVYCIPWQCCCHGSILSYTGTLMSHRRNLELHVLFVEDLNPIIEEED